MSELQFLLTGKPHPVLPFIPRKVTTIMPEDIDDQEAIAPYVPRAKSITAHILKHLQEHGRTEWNALKENLGRQCIDKSFRNSVSMLRRQRMIEVINDNGGNYVRLSIALDNALAQGRVD